MLQALLRRKDALSRINAHRLRSGFVNGIDWLLRDPNSVVGQTPWSKVLHEDKLVLRRYKPSKTKRYKTPVLLIPPLMVKPFIFDLHPGRSLVGHLLDEGFPVYLVDFGEPDKADAYITLDDYVCDWMPKVCSKVLQDAKSDHVSLLGYCMGGLFALAHTAANDDATVKNIVAIAAPVDTRKMGMFAWIAQRGGGQIARMTKHLGNVPGAVSGTAFKMLSPVKNLTRYADLFMNMYDKEYVNGFDAMGAWTSQFIDYPQGAFEQFLRDFMQHNKLYDGSMKFRDKVADLSKIRAPLLLFAGSSDSVVPEAAVRGALEAVGSEDKTFELVPGGHMGVFAGSRAPQNVWSKTASWLAERSEG